MKRKTVVTSVVMFLLAFSGLTQFSENVRTVQILGLFACGALFGLGLSALSIALKREQKTM